MIEKTGVHQLREAVICSKHAMKSLISSLHEFATSQYWRYHVAPHAPIVGRYTGCRMLHLWCLNCFRYI